MCVISKRAMYNTGSSLINDRCLRRFSQLMRQNMLTKEASVCVWLSIDHMLVTRVESGRMILENDDFIPHHMYQLEVCCVLQLFQGFPSEHLQRGQFTKCHKHLRMWGVIGMLFMVLRNCPSILIESHMRMYDIRCWLHFGCGSSLQYPEFTPPGLFFLCWCAIVQQCYMSVI